MSPKYHARGRDRGACGHEHASIALAFECCLRDWKAAEAEGDRSDRQVQRCDRRELSQREFYVLVKLEEALPPIAEEAPAHTCKPSSEEHEPMRDMDGSWWHPDPEPCEACDLEYGRLAEREAERQADGSPDAPAPHIWVRCEYFGCPGKGMWTRAGDARVLCTQHHRIAQRKEGE